MQNPGHLPPALPPTHYLDNRIFTDASIFREEQERLFSKVWQFVCHESELPNSGDFRTTQVAGKPLIVVRDESGSIRAFFNVCRHRAAEVVRSESGNARSFTCFYHHWNYGLDGSLRAVSKPEGYERACLDKAALGLVPVRTESVLGLVFTCLDPQAPALREYLGEILRPLQDPLGSVPMQVIHFHKAVVKTNWKLWQDNNSERYHSMLHAINRATQPWVLGKTSPMKLRLFPNGHSGYWSEGEAAVAYERGGYTNVTGGTLPGMRDNEMRVVNLFPDLMVNIRSNVVRIDRMIPIDEQHTMVEWRGLGVAGDDAETRELRLRHHNMFWGPAGRNLPEDLIAVESQYRAMRADAVRYSILAREEDLNPTDDANLRAYYQEWNRLMGRSASAPFEAHAQEVTL